MKMAFDVADQLEGRAGRRRSSPYTRSSRSTTEGLAGYLGRFEQVVVIEEHSEVGGLAAQVKQIAWDCRAACDLRTFSLKDEFIHSFGSHAELLAAHGLAGRARVVRNADPH